MIPLRDHNPTRTVPFVTASIILANIAVFAYQIDLLTQDRREMDQFIRQMSMIPWKVTHQFGVESVRSVFTSMFRAFEMRSSGTPRSMAFKIILCS